MKRKRLAFTLIELLVVIAIIAILAAILFPVFAQAKVSAKQVQTISNMKQIMMGIGMYMTDSDDAFVPRFRVGWGPPNYGDTSDGMPWDKLVQPYVKNFQITESPMDPNQKFPTPHGRLRRGYGVASNVFTAAQFGPNSRYYNRNAVEHQARTASTIPEPSRTIAVGERRLVIDDGAPQNHKTDPWPTESWGLPSAEINITRGLNLAPYGEISYSFRQGAVWGFVDGHVKWYAMNGHRQTDRKLVGTVFEGYMMGAVYGGRDPYWDTGISCMRARWYLTSEPICPVPGEM